MSEATGIVEEIEEATHVVAEAIPPLLQEVVDFLHRLFPDHGAPGIPTNAVVTEPVSAALAP